MPPRTIDNLGVDASTRYAEDRLALDETLLKEARSIPVQTEIEVTSPFFPSEIEALFHIQPTHIAWAFFAAPPYYFEQRKRLFTFQLIPSMGSEDKKESQALKILAKLKSTAQEREKEGKDRRQQYEEEREIEEEEKEKKILTSLLNSIAFFDKLIIEINSRRSQYQKG